MASLEPHNGQNAAGTTRPGKRVIDASLGQTAKQSNTRQHTKAKKHEKGRKHKRRQNTSFVHRPRTLSLECSEESPTSKHTHTCGYMHTHIHTHTNTHTHTDRHIDTLTHIILSRSGTETTAAATERTDPPHRLTKHRRRRRTQATSTPKITAYQALWVSKESITAVLLWSQPNDPSKGTFGRSP